MASDHAVHHRQAQAQGQRGQERGGTTGRAQVPRVQLHTTGAEAANCAESLERVQRPSPGADACRTRGDKLERIVEELAPYLSGWRGYFGFCQTPSVLRNLEQWIRRRLRSISGNSGKHRKKRFRELRDAASRSSPHRLPPVRRQGPGACPGTRRSSTPCRTTSSMLSVSPEYSVSGRAQLSRTAVVRTRMPGGVGGAASRGVPLSRSILLNHHFQK